MTLEIARARRKHRQDTGEWIPIGHAAASVTRKLERDMTAKELAIKAQAPLEVAHPENTALTPMAMLDRAVSQGANVETLDKLMGLQERWEANRARKAFDAAIAAAKAELPIIVKTQEKTGAGGNYRYEDLAAIARQVDPILAKHGLSYRFRTESNGTVKVTCIVSHRDGHSEENSLSAAPDTSGSKNAIQAIGSAVTYLQRYSLKAALGLAASKDDDTAVPADYITTEQAIELQDLVKKAGGRDAVFLEWIGAKQFDLIPAGKYERARKECLDAIKTKDAQK